MHNFNHYGIIQKTVFPNCGLPVGSEMIYHFWKNILLIKEKSKKFFEKSKKKKEYNMLDI